MNRVEKPFTHTRARARAHTHTHTERERERERERDKKNISTIMRYKVHWIKKLLAI